MQPTPQPEAEREQRAQELIRQRAPMHTLLTLFLGDRQIRGQQAQPELEQTDDDDRHD